MIFFASFVPLPFFFFLFFFVWRLRGGWWVKEDTQYIASLFFTFLQNNGLNGTTMPRQSKLKGNSPFTVYGQSTQKSPDKYSLYGTLKLVPCVYMWKDNIYLYIYICYFPHVIDVAAMSRFGGYENTKITQWAPKVSKPSEYCDFKPRFPVGTCVQKDHIYMCVCVL